MTKPSLTNSEDLADLDHLVVVDVAGGLQHEEERVAVHLELRALVRLDRVLDRQRVEAELAPRPRRTPRSRRLVQADPDERVRRAGGFDGVLERQLARRRRPSS